MASDKERVLAVYPDASWKPQYGAVYDDNEDPSRERLSGVTWWKDENLAWADAASRLPASPIAEPVPNIPANSVPYLASSRITEQAAPVSEGETRCAGCARIITKTESGDWTDAQGRTYHIGNELDTSFPHYPHTPKQAAGDGATPNGVELIAAERVRQVSVEGWTPEHDDKHDGGELVSAAVTYALEATFNGPLAASRWFKQFWCFEDSWFKLSPDPIRNLVKAGALIAAEIDRLQRLNPVAQPSASQQENRESGETNLLERA